MSMYRKSFAEVNLNHLQSNLKYVLSLAGANRFVCPMIKANAYGHGAIPSAQALLKVAKLPLGVALVEEALQLREAGITSEILVFGGFDQHGAQKIMEAELTPVISQFEQLQFLSVLAQKKMNVHIKFNTGMNRLGFSWQDIEKLKTFFKNQDKLILQSLLTHLHSSHLINEVGSSAEQQLKDFQKIYDEFSSFEVTAHTLNSDGIIALGKHQSQNWGFRPGIMLYGYCSSQSVIQQHLKPVMTVKSYVQNYQRIKKGESVSYNASWIAARDSVIGIIPMGYADGIHRLVSNRGEVLIGDKKHPIVGKVCMDFMMIDMTDSKYVSQDHPEVVIFGENHGADIFAQAAETISYEALTSISYRVPRVYVGDKI